MVVVRLPGVLRPKAEDRAEVEVDVPAGTTLGEVLDVLAERHPGLERKLRDEQGDLRRYVNFYVDGEECRRLGGKDTPLPAGAVVQIIPSVAGG
ncbi:ubiquitin-like small modifier protein 1 [Actinokineospora guangxiensis]|uniref:Ubiquitin-like small modifier protein 1 n=1 Tax=Actinokineospora guangxiensis TaxID=1490288 RepID=A0ABW0EIS6_9PSEU